MDIFFLLCNFCWMYGYDWLLRFCILVSLVFWNYFFYFGWGYEWTGLDFPFCCFISIPTAVSTLSKGLFQGKPKGIQLSNIIVLLTLSPIIYIVLANIYNIDHKIHWFSFTLISKIHNLMSYCNFLLSVIGFYLINIQVCMIVVRP